MIKRFTFFYTLFLLLLSLKALAQLNEADTTKWQYRLSGTGIFFSGNVKDMVISSRAEIAYNHERWGVFSGTSYVYKNRELEVVASDLVSRNILYYGQRRHLYPFLFSTLGSSVRRGIDFQWQLGPGLAYRFSNEIDRYLRLGSAIVYESGRFKNGYFDNYKSLSSEVNLGRAVLFATGSYKTSKNLALNYEISWQPGISVHNNRVSGLAGIQVPVTRFVSIRANTEYNFESLTLRGKSKNDLFLTFGVSISNIFYDQQEAPEEE